MQDGCHPKEAMKQWSNEAMTTQPNRSSRQKLRSSRQKVVRKCSWTFLRNSWRWYFLTSTSTEQSTLWPTLPTKRWLACGTFQCYFDEPGSPSSCHTMSSMHNFSRGFFSRPQSRGNEAIRNQDENQHLCAFGFRESLLALLWMADKQCWFGCVLGGIDVAYDSLVDTQKISHQHRKQKIMNCKAQVLAWKGGSFSWSPLHCLPLGWLVTSFDGAYPNLIVVDYLWCKTESSLVEEQLHRRLI
jgi:hypothetical protein